MISELRRSDSGSFKLLANESARIERSAAVKSRISCWAGAAAVGGWSSEVFASGMTAAHPAHDMTKSIENQKANLECWNGLANSSRIEGTIHRRSSDFECFRNLRCAQTLLL